MGGRKIDANICLFKKTRVRIVLRFKCLKTFYQSSDLLLGKRDFSKDIYIFKNNHSKKPLGKRGPRVRPTHLMCPQFTRGKNQWLFPPRGSPFSLRCRRSSLPPLVGPAAGRRTKARPKRLRWPDYLLDLILYASTRPSRGMGGRKTQKKHVITKRMQNADSIKHAGLIFFPNL